MNPDQQKAFEGLEKEDRLEWNGDKWVIKNGCDCGAEQLVLNPLVKELVRVLGMVTCVGSPYDEIINEALAPFKEVVE